MPLGQLAPTCMRSNLPMTGREGCPKILPLRKVRHKSMRPLCSLTSEHLASAYSTTVSRICTSQETYSSRCVPIRIMPELLCAKSSYSSNLQDNCSGFHTYLRQAQNARNLGEDRIQCGHHSLLCKQGDWELQMLGIFSRREVENALDNALESCKTWRWCIA